MGHALLTFTPSESTAPETYLITLPSLHIESLIYGSPFVELNKYTYIVSSTGYVAKIDYSGRGWLSGKRNSFIATLWKADEGSEKSLYSVEGQWSDCFVIKEGDIKHGNVIDTYNAKTTKTTPLQVKPIEEQDPYESRKAWRKVAQSIENGDMDSASHYKSRIENAQRALRKREREEEREWDRVFFKRIHNDDDNEAGFQKLVNLVHGLGGWTGVEADKTGGVWRFDEQKTREAKSPYHPEGLVGLGENEDGTSAPITPVTTSTSMDGKQ